MGRTAHCDGVGLKVKTQCLLLQIILGKMQPEEGEAQALSFMR